MKSIFGPFGIRQNFLLTYKFVKLVTLSTLTSDIDVTLFKDFLNETDRKVGIAQDSLALKITKNNHCDGGIFEHDFRFLSELFFATSCNFLSD